MKAFFMFLNIAMATSISYVSVIVDLSKWNPNIEFKLAKQDGIAAVIHKATEGATLVDPKYLERRLLAEKEGLLWGAYHFGVGSSNGTEQANHFLKTVGNYTEVLLVLDIEPSENRGGIMNVRQAEDFVQRVCEVTGRYPMVYGSVHFLSSYTTDTLKKCSLWIANWTERKGPTLPKGRDSWVMWQYTDGKHGGKPRKVKGIGPCDRDRYNGTLVDLRRKWPNLL